MEIKLNLKNKWLRHKEWVQFKKKNNKFKKELRKVIKTYGPWDYGFMLEFMEICTRHMAEYYHDDNWVFSDYLDYEKEKTPSRETIATNLNNYIQKVQEANITEVDDLKKLCDYMNEYLFYLWD